MTDVRAWTEVNRVEDWSTLLFGNGFSRNVWNAFAYDELLDRADLDPDALRDLFAEFHSSNFEHILAALKTTQRTLNALGEDTTDIGTLHESLRTALIEAVHRVHPQHYAVQASFEAVAAALADYHRVFTTNYDLLPYWSVMDTGLIHRIKDAFWSADNSFDRFNAESGDTLLFYLHGPFISTKTTRASPTSSRAVPVNF